LARRAAAARTFSAWAHRDGRLPADVAAVLVSPKPRRGLPSVLRMEQAAALLESAREAFTAGLNVTAGVGIVAMVVFGAVALRMLRGVGEAVPEAREETIGERSDQLEQSDQIDESAEPEQADEFVRPAESVQVTEPDADPTGRTR
jgi:Sec-independent protein translocase protein TatA